MQLFRRMGCVVCATRQFRLRDKAGVNCVSRPRVILVEDQGALCGLVTVKDVLRYTIAESGEAVRSWDDVSQFEGIIEDTWTWITLRTNSLISLCRRLLRR